MNDATHDVCNALEMLLSKAARQAGAGFSGLGVIVSESATSLPIFPIGPAEIFDPTGDPVELFAKISLADSRHHDGFHILTPALKVAAISQYFSPPVVPGLAVNRELPFGGRYLAAMFGSMIDGVVATGIATHALGVVVFSQGREVKRQPL